MAAPVLNGNEDRYVAECLDSTRLSHGPFVRRFEQAFAGWVGTPHAVATSSGTTALHLALLGLGVQPGDEVLVPATTFIATANAVRYCGAIPVFVDVEPQTWCLDASKIGPRVTSKTVGIIAVHLYGVPADLGLLSRIAKHHGLWLLEDAAEAHGAKAHGKRVGSIGDAGVFSFYGNKILTCGEGGMVTTADGSLAGRIRHLAAGCQTAPGRYEHDGVGYNYRLTDLQAAVGLAQVERAEWHLAVRRVLRTLYSHHLQGQGLSFQQTGSLNDERAPWTLPVPLPHGAPRPCEVATLLAIAGVETRPIFMPLPWLPPIRMDAAIQKQLGFSNPGLLLPLHAGMTEPDVRTVCDVLGYVLARTGVAA